MEEGSQIRNNAPGVSQMQRPANRPLHNIRREQTYQYKEK